MAEIVDLDHTWGDDVIESASGDLGSVSGSMRTKQRILRRMFTCPREVLPDGSILPPDDIFAPEYGAGLSRIVGRVVRIPETEGMILAQLRLEDAVAKTPAPSVKISPILNGISVYLKYYDQVANKPATLSFNVTPQS